MLKPKRPLVTVKGPTAIAVIRTPRTVGKQTTERVNTALTGHPWNPWAEGFGYTRKSGNVVLYAKRPARMSDFLKLLLPIFLSPTNYLEMLKKLGSFLFYEVWLATFLLREIPDVDAAFRSVENFGHVGSALALIPGHEKINLSGFAVALFVAVISYSIQLHDRISDIFGIRKRFDRNYIILPLAVLVGAKLSPTQLNSAVVNRHTLLRTIFYPFVSSTAENPVVDRHEIWRVLDVWSWYWILIESLPVVLVSAVVAAAFAAHSLLVGFGLAFIGLLFVTWIYSFRLERFEAIAANPNAALAVREAFSAL